MIIKTEQSISRLSHKTILDADYLVSTNGLNINTNIVVGGKKWCNVKSVRLVADAHGIDYDDGYITIYPSKSGFKDLTDDDLQQILNSQIVLVVRDGEPLVYFDGDLLGGIYKIVVSASLNNRVEVFVDISDWARATSPLAAPGIEGFRYLKVRWCEGNND